MEEPDHIFDELGLASRRPPELFRSLGDVISGPLNGYSHVLRRAWNAFDGLAGVLSIDKRPSLYVQLAPTPGRISLHEQRRFWSQGTAPMLVRITGEEVQIYSGLRSPALDDEDVDGNERLVEVFERSTQALEIRQFIRSVETGAVYEHHREHFDPTQGVDRRLVENLAAARLEMSAGPKAPDLTAIHRILGRTLFTCYLEARGALVGRDFGRLGAGAAAKFRQLLEIPDVDLSRRALGKLFRRLGRYVSGNLTEDTYPHRP
jgi:hypothetical protein